MAVVVRRDDFLQDRQGKRFADVWNDPQQPLEEVLAFLSDEGRQRRMEEAEVHHDRPPLAGVVRELEAQPAIGAVLASPLPHRSKRLRQAIGVVVRIIMERRGWKKTGRKGSLGVRRARPAGNVAPSHNSGGLAFWFLRAERYRHQDGMPFLSVREQLQSQAAATESPKPSPP